MSQRLSNYLRTYRKHQGLSQEDLAHLLGSGQRSNVSLHEKGERVPGLEKALTYAAALQVPAEELFAGTYEKVESQVAERARELADELSDEDSPRLSQKIETLEELAAPARTEASVCV